MSDAKAWEPCKTAKIADILRWDEPLWAAPNKPRGKPDKIGEQQITARVLAISDFLECEVLAVEKLTPGDAAMKVQVGDKIRRKKTSIDLGNCHRQVTTAA
jgi:hypothetical protein